MKTSAIFVVAAAAVAQAKPQSVPSNIPINCAKPNANYCMGGDIILRCDGNSLGTRGRCSDNVSGYPPAGGVASCYQSSELAGDAACQKNCVVYAQPSFTLAADKCTPSATETGSPPPSSTQSSTGSSSAKPTSTASTEPGSTSSASKAPETTSTTVSDAGTTGIVSIPESIPPASTTSNSTTVFTNPIRTSETVSPTAKPTQTHSTGSASSNHAAGLLAFFGAVAAFLI